MGARRFRYARLPPEFPERLGELGVVQVRVLVGELPPGGLGPNHERVHRSLHVQLPFVGGGSGIEGN